jgi:hypothetical protein
MYNIRHISILSLNIMPNSVFPAYKAMQKGPNQIKIIQK